MANKMPRKFPVAIHQRGVVTVEYALIMLFGIIPLLLITFSGVMIFAAKQTLTLAASEGARASLRYGDEISDRQVAACQVASETMKWLSNFSKVSPDCSSYSKAPLVVSYQSSCGTTALPCITVTASYDYDKYPFLPGTVKVYNWVIGSSISSTAVAQLDDD